MDERPPPDRAFQSGAKLVALVAALAAGWLARDVLLLVFLGVLIGVVLSFPVGFLARHMKRGFAVLIVLVVLLAGAGAAVGFGAAKIAEQFDTVRADAQKAVRAVQEKLAAARGQKPGSSGKDSGLPPAAGEKAVEGAKGVLSFVTALVLVLVLGLFLVNEPGVYARGLRLLVPRRHEDAFDSSFALVSTGLRKWVGGILVSMAIMGAVTTVGLAIAGIKGFLVLGLLTFFATFVPYVGAVASAIPGLLVAAAQDQTHFLYALAVYLGVHVVEGYLVEPLVMKRAVKLQPALLLAWQGFFTAVFGLAGTVVATPVLVCVQILTQHLWVARRLGKGAA